ncbi:MAG: hypothetical protein WCR08_03715 [Gammaproteobacteria bacterium]
MTTSINTKLLVPLWGERYINNFCDIALPALLAKGNISTLTKAGNCKLKFLTTKSSEQYFYKKDAMKRLMEICDVSFSFIDDLLEIGSYGVILTLAYERGILEEPEELQLETHFIFLNADFIIPEHFFSNLIEYLQTGVNAVLLPSLRANEEDVVDILRRQVSPVTFTSENSSRFLVNLALKNLHPTVEAGIINKSHLHNTVAHQFFYDVNENTLIGRFFLLFMLCIKPEVLLKRTSGFCDYTFVPDLCPSGNYVIIDDSDKLFLLELTPKHKEEEYLRLGIREPADHSGRLTEWTTKNHRDYSKHTIVFHSDAVPSTIKQAQRELDKYMNKIYQSMSSNIQSHLNHPYWIGTLKSLQNTLKDERLSEWISEKKILPVEITEDRIIAKNKHEWFFKINKTIIRRCHNAFINCFVGLPPDVRIWHPDWLDYHALIKSLKKAQQQTGGPVLYIKDGKTPFDCAFDQKYVINLENVLDDNLFNEKITFEFCFIYINIENIDRYSLLKDKISLLLSESGIMLLFINGNSKQFFTHNQLDHDLLPQSYKIIETVGTGGLLKILTRTSIVDATNTLLLNKFSRGIIPFFKICVLCLTGLFVINLRCYFFKKKNHKYLTSVVFKMSSVRSLENTN